MNDIEHPGDRLAIGYVARPEHLAAEAEEALRTIAEVMDVQLLRVIVKPSDWLLPLNQRFGLEEAIRPVEAQEAITLIIDHETLASTTRDEVTALGERLTAVNGDLMLVDLRVHVTGSAFAGAAGDLP